MACCGILTILQQLYISSLIYTKAVFFLWGYLSLIVPSKVFLGPMTPAGDVPRYVGLKVLLIQGPSCQILGQRSPVLRCVPPQLPLTYLPHARPSEPDLQKLPGNYLLAQYLLSSILRWPSNQRAL